MNHFYSVDSVDNLDSLVQRCREIKENPLRNSQLGKNKLLVLLFFNPSLRTRISTQKAAYNLGMDVIVMNMKEGWKWEMEDGAVMNMDTAEHIKEGVRVVSSYADVIGVRTFPSLENKVDDYEDKVIKAMMKYSTVPVISLESATLHPLQSLTDLYTIQEKKNKKDLKIVLSWAPHPRALPQCVSNSFLQWMKAAGHSVTICNPQGYNLDPKFADIHTLSHDQEEAFKDADVIYVKNWSSVDEYGKILTQDDSWMITEEKLKATNDAILMHCLPVRRNVVIADNAIDSDHSVVIEQAANREVAAQAVLEEILQKSS